VVEHHGLVISADHRLLLPASVLDMKDDVTALLDYLEFSQDLPAYDKTSVVVSGDSSGALLALFAAWHGKIGGSRVRGLLPISPLGGASWVRHPFECVSADSPTASP
jgi:acetyl esterase/lipase